jgi:hypothetical protein
MRGRPESSTRILAEHCTVLDIAEIPRPIPKSEPEDDPWVRFVYPHGRPAPDATVTLTWADGGQTRVRVNLTTTKPHFGGVRYWYVCPHCGRRSAKLYATNRERTVACRVCLRLVYSCQYRKGWRQALFRRIRKWEEASPAYRRRWCKRFRRACESGRITNLEFWALLNFTMDLPKGC